MSLFERAGWRTWVMAVVLLGGGTTAKPAYGDEEAVLRLGFTQNQTLRYRFQQTNTIKVKANGQETSNASDLAIDFHWDVKAVDASGVAEVSQTLDRVKVGLTVGSKTYRLDTKEPAEKDDPVAKPLSQVYRAAVAGGATFKVTPRGEVRDVVVPAAVADALRGSPFEASADGGSVFTPAGIANMFAQVMPLLPEGPVKVGAAWNREVELPTGLMSVRLTGASKLVKLGPTAEIETTLTTALTPNPGVSATVEIKTQKGTGRYVLDARAQRLTEASLKQTLEITLGLGKAAIEQSSVATTSLTLVP